MPELLPKWEPFNRKAGAREKKYPWELWLDGTPRLFAQGEDYLCKTSSFISSASRAAIELGVAIRTSMNEEGTEVRLQAIDLENKRSRKKKEA